MLFVECGQNSLLSRALKEVRKEPGGYLEEGQQREGPKAGVRRSSKEVSEAGAER